MQYIKKSHNETYAMKYLQKIIWKNQLKYLLQITWDILTAVSHLPESRDNKILIHVKWD